MTQKPSTAVVGLAVMGSNLARNIESRGYPVAVYNRTTEVTDSFMKDFKGNFTAAKTPAELIASMERPRKIIIMVKAGAGTDAVIDTLLPLVDQGDVIIDGGNAYYKDTIRREASCKARGVHFLGVGISGGEEGALKGPSIMPGGPKDAWEKISKILSDISAKVDGTPCTAYIGPDGAGHFVKMVHNGIEYGDIQLIAEAYHVLRDLLGSEAQQLQSIFENWNKGPLSSFLVEITAKIFNKKDDQGDGYLVDKILDKAGQKGTGKWTVLEALELGVPVPTLAAAVDARVLSSLKDERVIASKALPGPEKRILGLDRETMIGKVHDALYAAKILSYAQGMALLSAASKANNWNLKLDEIASLWRGGCIIRAVFLEQIRKAFAKTPTLSNLLFDPAMREEVAKSVAGLRTVVEICSLHGIPIPAFSSALSYYDMYRTEHLPLNLTQAQRDFFGAHTFERTDMPGSFHAHWE